MSSTLTASRWHTEGNVPDFVSAFSDGNDTLFMAVWPRMYHQDLPDDPSAPSAISTISRRMMPDEPSDHGKPVSTTDKKKDKKKMDTTTSSGPRGAPKKRKPVKKPDPPSVPIYKRPSPPPGPVKKHKSDIGAPKKKRSAPEPAPSGAFPPGALPQIPVPPVVTRPPQVKNINPDPAPAESGGDDPMPSTPIPENVPDGNGASVPIPPEEDSVNDPAVEPALPIADEDPVVVAEAEPTPLISDEVPVEIPVTDPGSSISDEVPVVVPEAEPSPPITDSDIGNTLTADPDPAGTDSLTDKTGGDSIDERTHTEHIPGFLSRAGDYFKDLLGDIFMEKKGSMADDFTFHSYVPVALPPPRNPAVEVDPVGSFRAGYISQRDIEEATGRDDWTMCCATTFVYAVQAKYPGLGRNEILEAAGRAANTPLTDGNGCCVSDSGYIGSIYQYSQALSKNLGLDEYIDTPGQYPSIEAAREAGVEMMKVELSGTLRGKSQEHHVLQINGVEIDPAGKNGIDKLWDAGSRNEEAVMALDWYSLP